MTTMKEIASLAHVSRATVSRVLSGSPLVRESTRESVLYWVEKTGFQPDR
ncbi:MAG: LacI family DNA-binding transcriptional regulator, partial [Lachnospiraceae bacterium]|nr:LacI family DNA-binding transcriptional regulator [Lachnospiraceae bacterium]